MTEQGDLLFDSVAHSCTITTRKILAHFSRFEQFFASFLLIFVRIILQLNFAQLSVRGLFVRTSFFFFFFLTRLGKRDHIGHFKIGSQKTR